MKKYLLTFILFIAGIVSFTFGNGETNCYNPLGDSGNTNCVTSAYLTDAAQDEYDLLSAKEKLIIEKVFNQFLTKLLKKGDDATLKRLHKLITKIDETVQALSLQSNTNAQRNIAILNYLRSLAAQGFEIGEVEVTQLDENNIEVEKKTGYITDMYETDGIEYIDFELIEFYTGDEAAQQMELNDPQMCKEIKEMDGLDKCWPLNDYYIIRTDLVQTYSVDEFVKIYMQTYTFEDGTMHRDEEISYEILKDIVENGNVYENFTMHYDSVPFHFELIDDTIVKITEQFIP